MHVKMTRIERGVTVPKGLFSLYTLCQDIIDFIRGDQEGLFKLVTLDRILNRICRSRLF
jgi:hypothetical protein